MADKILNGSLQRMDVHRFSVYQPAAGQDCGPHRTCACSATAQSPPATMASARLRRCFERWSAYDPTRPWPKAASEKNAFRKGSAQPAPTGPKAFHCSAWTPANCSAAYRGSQADPARMKVQEDKRYINDLFLYSYGQHREENTAAH